MGPIRQQSRAPWRPNPGPAGARWLAAPLAAVLTLAAGCTGDDGSGADGLTANSLRVETTVTEDGSIETVPPTVAVPVIEAAPGVVVWAAEREPPDLHVDDPDNRTEIASWIRQGLVEGLYGVGGDVTYVPELLAAEAAVTVNNSGTVQIGYELRAGLRWSDGEPLTAADVAYTHRVITEGCQKEADGSIADGTTNGCAYKGGDRVGYDLVTAFEVQDDTHFSITLASFYPGWRDLYGEVFAEHAFGESADAVNANLAEWQGSDGPLPSSGPLLFQSWERGARLQLGANPDYHGSTNPEVGNTGPPTVAGVQVVFVPDPAARRELLTSGAADLLVTTPDPALAGVADTDGVTLAGRVGEDYDLLGINLLDGHLAKAAVRQAIAYAVDKPALVQEVYQPLVGDSVPADGLGNTYWMPSQPGYVDHQAGFAGHQPEAARSALEEAGYVAGSDGVYEHPEAGRLALRASTTGGDPLREALLEGLAGQLREVGFEITVENIPGGLFYEQGPFSPEALAASESDGRDGDADRWDLALYSWATGPWPGGVSGAYRSGSAANPYGFTQPDFDAAAVQCDTNADDAARIDCYNGLDAFATTLDNGEDGLFVVPITQKPHVVAYGPGLSAIGVVPDAFRGGPLVGVADVTLAG